MNREGALREELIAHLERTRILRDPRIAAALRAVDRHRFIPAVNAQEAYEDKALAIKERDGLVISSISQPSMIVHMLELLEVRSADRVLEIGTGSGYNAALLGELARTGTVVSVEIERDLIERARAVLDEEGYRRVVLLHAEQLRDVHRAFERIIVTARSQDIDPDWWRLLAPGGRMVVPLDIGYGGERAIGFVREGDRLQSVGSYACAFVELRVAEAPHEAAMFFRTRAARHERQPGANTPLDVIAVERSRADVSLLESADAVVARPHTLFAVTRSF
ncbi:MAG TPA: methyltransferase domain-containing protein [Candidatus Acidoferrales bacterium]|nr:methyltransferase domain-containing protein [Candidatus Acidoferrales bacterium]